MHLLGHGTFYFDVFLLGPLKVLDMRDLFFNNKKLLMPQKLELILLDMISFLSLLKIINRLAQLRPGDLIEVVLNNAEIVQDLQKIVSRSSNRVVGKTRDGDIFRTCIVKGNNTH